MAENSAISWTDHTFNPWWGCTKVGPGCDHCYAETFDKRVGGAHWGPGAPRRLVKDWSKPRKWDREAAKTGVRPWVFCASMADVFDNEVPPEWRARLWDFVRECRNLNWIFVTKRIGNAAKMLPADWPEAFPNCGIVITIVNQAEADRDVSKLLFTPAAWRGLSMEPLLGPVDLTDLGGPGSAKSYGAHGFSALWSICDRPRLDWVIVGGESGHCARPMHQDWARSLRDQCVASGVPFHFKQWGEWSFEGQTSYQPGCSFFNAAGEPVDEKPPFGPSTGARWHWWEPNYLASYRVGKKAAGRLLDGIEHNGMPRAAAAPLAGAA